MTVVFESRATYDPEKDPVAKVTVTVECHPKQAVSVTNFLSAVKTQAGVYSVEIGEASGEQPVQQANPDDSGKDDGGPGKDAVAGPTAEVGPADGAVKELARAPGAGAEAGPGKRGSGGKDLRDSPRAARRR